MPFGGGGVHIVCILTACFLIVSFVLVGCMYPEWYPLGTSFYKLIVITFCSVMLTRRRHSLPLRFGRWQCVVLDYSTGEYCRACHKNRVSIAWHFVLLRYQLASWLF